VQKFSRFLIGRDFVITTNHRPLVRFSRSFYSQSRARIFVTWFLNCLSTHSRWSMFLGQAMNSLIGYQESAWRRSTTTRITEWVAKRLSRYCIDGIGSSFFLHRIGGQCCFLGVQGFTEAMLICSKLQRTWTWLGKTSRRTSDSTWEIVAVLCPRRIVENLRSGEHLKRFYLRIPLMR
jgi:hypothetical protein